MEKITLKIEIPKEYSITGASLSTTVIYEIIEREGKPMVLFWNMTFWGIDAFMFAHPTMKLLEWLENECMENADKLIEQSIGI